MGVLTEDKLAALRIATLSERGNRLDIAIKLSRLTQQHIAKSLRLPATCRRAVLLTYRAVGV